MDVFTEKRKERENMHLHKLADLLSFHEVEEPFPRQSIIVKS